MKILKSEDHWSIGIGTFLLATALVLMSIFLPSGWDKLSSYDQVIEQESEQAFKTIRWYQAIDQQQSVKGVSTPLGNGFKKLTSKPGKWKDSPLEAYVMTERQAMLKNQPLTKELETLRKEKEALLTKALKLEEEARSLEFKNEALNREATHAIQMWRKGLSEWQYLKKKAQKKPFNKSPYLALFFVCLLIIFGVGSRALGVPFVQFGKSFLVVFLLAILAYTLSGQQVIKSYGLGYAFWAIMIGLLISNTLGTPSWLKPALRTEFYVKTGLVLLGAEVLLGKILAIGLPGIFVAWVVTPIVLLTTYWFGQKVLRIPSKTLNMTICADMSVCGVSAAVATAAACRAKKEELTLAIGLSMIFTSVMMIAMPAFIKAVGIPEILGGAWIGGTLDATGAVVAAGAFLGDDALSVAATIKMIQNVLIGIIAFSVAMYFSKAEGASSSISWKEIFRRFPRFIFGFLLLSVVFSILYEVLGDAKAYALIDQGVISSFSKNIRSWCFCLAFVSIGLSTDFKQFKPYIKDGKPFVLYLCGQTFNILLTLLVAYLMFYVVFPEITNSI